MRDPRYLLPSRLRKARSSARSPFWRDKAACVASVVLEALGVVFALGVVLAYVDILVLLAALCV